MIQANAYIKQLESERRLLQAQVKRLIQENSWLREELNAAHQKSQENDQAIAALEVEKKHLEFLNSLKKFETQDATDESIKNVSLSRPNILSNPKFALNDLKTILGLECVELAFLVFA